MCKSHPSHVWFPLILPRSGLRSEIDGVSVGPSSSPRFFHRRGGRGRRRRRSTQLQSRNPGDTQSVARQDQVWGRRPSHRSFHRRRRLFRLTHSPFLNVVTPTSFPSLSPLRSRTAFVFYPSVDSIPHSIAPILIFQPVCTYCFYNYRCIYSGIQDRRMLSPGGQDR